MRRKLIAANWKMHPYPFGWDATDSPYRSAAGVDVVVFPSFLHITQCIEAKLTVGGQYGRPEPEGAFTGDVSMKMLKNLGCTHVLCGHSERRREHGETDAFVAEQVFTACEYGLHPIVCVGETKEERAKGKTQEIIKKQLSQLTARSSQLTIAYEPIWAIGTGLNALPEDVQQIHIFIRSFLEKDVQDATRIIYGGSVNDLNAADFLTHPDVDGLLVGSCSLNPRAFGYIVEAAIASRSSPPPTPPYTYFADLEDRSHTRPNHEKEKPFLP